MYVWVNKEGIYMVCRPKWRPNSLVLPTFFPRPSDPPPPKYINEVLGFSCGVRKYSLEEILNEVLGFSCNRRWHGMPVWRVTAP